MNARFGRALIAKEVMERHSIDSYVPMQEKIIAIKNNKRIKKLTPIFVNLIFIKSTYSTVKEICNSNPYIHYTYYKKDGKNTPMVVPDNDMERFIAVTSENQGDILYLSPDSIDYTKGERVLITEGPFRGKEAVFIKVKGKRSKQVVVAITGVVVAMITSLNPGMIERIK